MGLFSNRKKEKEVFQHSEALELTPEETTFSLLVNQKYTYLDSETSSLKESYNLYDNFLQGNQWVNIIVKQELGEERITHNFCEPVVRKYASLLMGEVPKVSIPRESERRPRFDVSALENPPQKDEYDIETPIEFDRSEAVEKIIRQNWFEINSVEKEFYEGAYIGSGYGDTVFFIYWDKKKAHPILENIFPGNCRLSFATNNFRDIEYAFVEKFMSLDEILERFNFVAQADQIEVNDYVPQQFQDRPSAKVKYYWDKETYAVIINKIPVKIDEKGQRFIKHNYGRVPLFLVPNLVTGKNPRGISDLKDVVSIQESYNKALSDEANLSKMYAKPKIIVQNPGKTDLSNFKSPGGKVIPVSKDAVVRPLEFAGQLFPMQNRINRVKQDFHDVSGMPPIAFGTSQGSIVTGVAMTAQFAPTLQIIRTKMMIWNSVLKDMVSFTLDLYEKFGGKYPGTKLTYKEIINGWRYVEFQWGNKIPRDDSIYIQNELNKQTRGIQSITKTMTNLGIDSPQDELKQIILEKNNPDLNPKLAIEKAQAAASTGKGGEGEAVSEAEKENQTMTAGQSLPSVAKGKSGHQIHIETHGNYVVNREDLPEEIISIIDQHIAGHEQALAIGGTQGGLRVGAGRPEGLEEMPAIPALAATGNMPVGTQTE